MTGATAIQQVELQGREFEVRRHVEKLELRVAELKRRIDVLEHHIDARIIAVEQRHDRETADLRQEMRQVHLKLGALEATCGNLESLQRANHHAQIHLWGVLARQLEMPEARVVAAQRKAEKMLTRKGKRL